MPELCKARRVIDAAAAAGPGNGWVDGWLTLDAGLEEPDPGASLRALRSTTTTGRAVFDRARGLAKRPARGAENVLAFIGLDTAIDKHVTNWN